MVTLKLSVKNRRKPEGRRGIVLVLVLVMLALCGAISGQIATQVIRLSGRAAMAQHELQHRWAVVSMRRCFFQQAPSILGRTIKQDFAITLGTDRYAVQLHDESSKIPLRPLIKMRTQERVKAVIQGLANGGRPVRILDSDATQLLQIFQEPSSSNQLERLLEWSQYVDKLTLWSDGHLNYLSCEPETLDAFWKVRFGRLAPKSLHLARYPYAAETPQSPSSQSAPTSGYKRINENWNSFGLSEPEVDFARQFLTTRTTTYSLWIAESNLASGGKTAIYVASFSPHYAEEHFGFHDP